MQILALTNTQNDFMDSWVRSSSRHQRKHLHPVSAVSLSAGWGGAAGRGGEPQAEKIAFPSLLRQEGVCSLA